MENLAGEVNHLSEQVSLINPHYRRLDILAQMLEGEDQASSLCFDGQNLLFSCNSAKRIDLQKKLLSHLVRIANIDYSNQNWYEELHTTHEDVITEAKKFYSEYQKPKNGIRLDNDWLSNFQSNLSRIEGSLASAIVRNTQGNIDILRGSFPRNMTREDASFSLELATAFKNNKIIDLENIGGPGKVHAELRVVEYLLNSKKIQKRGKFYISTSKKCCRNCEAVIKSINKTFQSNSEGIAYSRSASLIETSSLTTRDLLTEGKGHEVLYGNSNPPKFITRNSSLRTEDREKIIEEFLKITGTTNINDSFNTNIKGEKKYLGHINSISPTSRRNRINLLKTLPIIPGNLKRNSGMPSFLPKPFPSINDEPPVSGIAFTPENSGSVSATKATTNNSTSFFEDELITSQSINQLTLDARIPELDEYFKNEKANSLQREPRKKEQPETNDSPTSSLISDAVKEEVKKAMQDGTPSNRDKFPLILKKRNKSSSLTP